MPRLLAVLRWARLVAREALRRKLIEDMPQATSPGTARAVTTGDEVITPNASSLSAARIG